MIRVIFVALAIGAFSAPVQAKIGKPLDLLQFITHKNKKPQHKAPIKNIGCGVFDFCDR